MDCFKRVKVEQGRQPYLYPPTLRQRLPFTEFPNVKGSRWRSVGGRGDVGFLALRPRWA